MNKPRFLSPVPPCYSTQRGFTLIELMVTVAVMAALLPIAFTGLGDAMTSIKLTSASNMLLSHIHHARSEAIKRNSRVVLCKSSDGASCAQTGGWEQGWIIFHDANNNGAREEAEIIIQREAALTGELKFTGNLNVARYLSFAPSGATRMVGGGYQLGTLTLCRQSTEAGEARQITFNAAGRARVQRVTIDSCT